jgi:thiosulfate dehydrogenase (quinone) large subunit
MEDRTGRRSGSAPVGPGAALLPLRLFLGGTFVYAGIQKLSDPGFFHNGAPTYIGTQLHNFANGTPGGFILRTFAIPHPVLAGVGVAILEILIGLLAALGLRTRLAAVAGLALSLLLFLTASWKTSPYFLGPDIVFAFAWLPFVLAGAEGQPALDHVAERGSAAVVRRTRLRPTAADAQAPESSSDPVLTRRALVAQTGAVALALAGIASLAKGGYRGPTNSPARDLSAGPTRTSGAAESAGSGTPSAVPENAVKLGPSNRLGAGQAASYSDPSDGSADILIRESNGSLKAFSAICTHAGCEVGYQSGQIVCPCHGAVYSAQTGQVEGGPAPQGLAQRRVIEDGGQIYAVPS